MQNDLKRDNNRNKRSRALISKIANTAGIEVEIAGGATTTPQPGDGFVMVEGQEVIIDLLHKEGASKKGVCFERIIDLVEDEAHHQLWLSYRHAWHRVGTIAILKRYKGGDTLISDVSCTLLCEGNVEKRVLRSSLTVETYGIGEGQTWIWYHSPPTVSIAPVALILDDINE
jgi:hypothetical protein